MFVLGVRFWRWMTSEEPDGNVVHDLHPVPGQFRLVAADEPEIDGQDADVNAADAELPEAASPHHEVDCSESGSEAGAAANNDFSWEEEQQ
jgi:hypothetical protein